MQSQTRTSGWVYGFVFVAVIGETFVSLAQNASSLPGIAPETRQSDELPRSAGSVFIIRTINNPWLVLSP